MNEQLTFRQQRAVESLIVCTSIRNAAKHGQLSERTLYRWLQEDECQSAVRRARQLSLTQLATHMQHMADRAVGTLSEVMEDKKATAASRVSAAYCSMEMYYKASTLEDITERLMTMEKNQKQAR